MTKVKPATTYREQIEILRKRNVQVSDYDACERFLHNVNYYRFTAYLLSFRQKEMVELSIAIINLATAIIVLKSTKN